MSTELAQPAHAPLPWHTHAWQRFNQALAVQRSAHALLLAGPTGLGKRALAQAMAARVLCDRPSNDLACGQCRGCQLRLAGSHPDYTVIEPEAGGSGILKIEAVRQLTTFSQRTSQYDGYRVAVLAPAEAMNRHTANALLKTLEEPPASVMLILVSHRPALLAATIRSRCQILTLNPPQQSQSLEWLTAQGIEQPALALMLAGGAPLAAQAIAEAGGTQQFAELINGVAAVAGGRASAVAVASEWQAIGARETTELMQRLTLLLARYQALSSSSPGLPASIEPLARATAPKRLQSIAEKLYQLRAATSQSLSRELSVEALFLLWTRA